MVLRHAACPAIDSLAALVPEHMGVGPTTIIPGLSPSLGPLEQATVVERDMMRAAKDGPKKPPKGVVVSQGPKAPKPTNVKLPEAWEAEVSEQQEEGV